MIRRTFELNEVYSPCSYVKLVAVPYLVDKFECVIGIEGEQYRSVTFLKEEDALDCLSRMYDRMLFCGDLAEMLDGFIAAAAFFGHKPLKFLSHKAFAEPDQA